MKKNTLRKIALGELHLSAKVFKNKPHQLESFIRKVEPEVQPSSSKDTNTFRLPQWNGVASS